MKQQIFVARSAVDAPPETVYRWHSRPGALPRLMPPWDPAEVVEPGDGIEEGSRVVLRVRVGPLRRRWVAVHLAPEPGRQFRDVQETGPFVRWLHTHRFEPRGRDGSWLEDRLAYRLPAGVVGRLVAGRFTRRKLERLFTFRHAVTRADLRRQLWRDDGRSLSIAVTGAGGLIGSSLVPFLATAGHRVLRLVRREPRDGSEIGWDPDAGRIDADRLRGVDAVVNLAGESIAGGRWTPARKQRIADSRVRGTRLIAETIARLARPPEVLVNASAIGFYGNRGDVPVDEDSAPGEGFLADTSKAWEEATGPATSAGIRVVRLRIGVVLSPRGGALASMLPLFRLGLGGRLGSGRQYMSWIGIEDVIGALYASIRDPGLTGAVNATAPGAVTNAEFTSVLARVLRRPAVLPAPAFALRLALGEMGQELLLDGARIAPRRLEQAGFEFMHPELEAALRFALGRFAPDRQRPEMHHGTEPE